MTSLGFEIDIAHVRYPSVRAGLEKTGKTLTCDQESPIVWWDGDVKARDFELLGHAQRISKIPGMDYICYKSSTIHALNQLRRMFPKVYNFFPLSFLLPHQIADLQRADKTIQTRTQDPVTWIVKPRSGCCGHGIRLTQDVTEFSHNSPASVVQLYMKPFLIEGRKFDFRLYILISSLAPLTVYLYNEGLARFCTSVYRPPSPRTLDDRFCHLTNTAVNKENEDAGEFVFTRLASEVIEEIRKSVDNKVDVWARLKRVSTLSVLGIWPSIVSSINKFNSERRLFGKRPPSPGEPVLDAFSKYFHILGIDIMLSDTLQPIVLELNDRPSMAVTYECEDQLKKNLIADAITHISIDGEPCDGPAASSNWMKILPVPPMSPMKKTVDGIILKESAVFRTLAANKPRPHYEPRPLPRISRAKSVPAGTFRKSAGTNSQ